MIEALTERTSRHNAAPRRIGGACCAIGFLAVALSGCKAGAEPSSQPSDSALCVIGGSGGCIQSSPTSPVLTMGAVGGKWEFAREVPADACAIGPVVASACPFRDTKLDQPDQLGGKAIVRFVLDPNGKRCIGVNPVPKSGYIQPLPAVVVPCSAAESQFVLETSGQVAGDNAIVNVAASNVGSGVLSCLAVTSANIPVVTGAAILGTLTTSLGRIRVTST